MPYYTPQPPSQPIRRFAGEIPPPVPRQIRSETGIGNPYAAERAGMRSETSTFAPRAVGELTNFDQGEYVTLEQHVSSLTDSYNLPVVYYAVANNLLTPVEIASFRDIPDLPSFTAPSLQVETQPSAQLELETGRPVAESQTTAFTVEAAPVDAPQVISGEPAATLEEIIAERDSSNPDVITVVFIPPVSGEE